MPRAGPLKQILRSMTVDELRSLRREHCPRVSEYGDNKASFVEKLRRSLQRQMDEREFTYEDLMDFVRDELTSNGPEYATTRIRQTLQEIEISPNAGSRDTTSVRERWIASEAYQALRYRFHDQPYVIEQEAMFGRSSVDLLMRHQSDDRNYLVEVKLAGSYSSRERLLSQLRKYRKKVPYLKRSYVLLVAERERDLPENKDSVAHVVEEVEDEPETEVVLKPPTDLQY